MKIAGLIFSLAVLFSAFSAARAQAVSHITGGKLAVNYNSIGSQAASTIVADNFSAIASVNDTLNGYWDRCLITSPGQFCETGSFVTLPVSPRVYIGRGTFAAGSVTVGATTLQNVFFTGYFDITQETFFIPKVARKGRLRYSRPFAIKGRLAACRTETKFGGCAPKDVIYDTEIDGHGTVDLTLRMLSPDVFSPHVFTALQESVEYTFEP